MLKVLLAESTSDGVVPTLHDQVPFRIMPEFSHFVQLIGADLILIFLGFILFDRMCTHVHAHE